MVGNNKQNNRMSKRMVQINMAIFAFVAMFVPAALFDSGRYEATFRDEGLVGFVLMPSILTLQFWTFAGVAVALMRGLTRAYSEQNSKAQFWLSIATPCVIGGIVGHIISVCGIAAIRQGGMFTVGLVGLIGLADMLFLASFLVGLILVVVGFSTSSE